MTTVDIKNSLHRSIDGIEDESFLKAIYTMLTSLMSNEAVGYVGSKKLTKVDILKNEIDAEEDIKAGRTHTSDQIREHFGLKK